jgi:hypothetical protein
MSQAEWVTKVPSNINPLSPQGFRFNITKLPEVEFFCQNVNLPGITLGDPEVNTPFSRIPVPGDMLTFDTLRIQFLVDEDLKNFRAVHNWMYGLGFPISHQQYRNYVGEQNFPMFDELTRNFSDATLLILTNNSNPGIIVNFRNVFPVELSTLEFTATDQDITYFVGTASFRFTYYEFE